MTSMITAAQWVPRGFAAPFPAKYELDEAEFDRIAQLAKLQLDDAEDDLKEAKEAHDEEEGVAKKSKNGSKEGDDEEMEVDESKADKNSDKVK
jgi:periodic tryptophan protein 1